MIDGQPDELTLGSEAARIQCGLCQRWYRAITHDHLVRTHGWIRDDVVARYKTQFGLRYVRSLATRNKWRASILATYNLRGMGRIWSERTLINEVDRIQCGLCQRWYRAITHDHLVRTHGWVGNDVVARYKAQFGLHYACSSTTRNKISAGIIETYNLIGRKWSVRTVIKALKARAEAGKPMDSTSVYQEEPALHGAAVKHCGRWSAACKQAGIKNYLKAPPWTTTRVVALIKALRKANKPVHQTAMRAEHSRVISGARNCIGQWTKALKLAGVPTKDRRMPRKVKRTEEWVIENIWKLYRNGQRLIGTGVPTSLRQGGEFRFGGWRLALKASGIPPEHFAPWTKERVITCIKARLRAKKPIYRQVVWIEDSGVIYGARKCIGKWSKALKLAGVPEKDRFMPRKVRTEEWVIENIRNRYRNGESLVCERVPGSLQAAGRNRFGGWRLALKAAGIPQKHRV